jgi:hypothetical protein
MCFGRRITAARSERALRRGVQPTEHFAVRCNCGHSCSCGLPGFTRHRHPTTSYHLATGRSHRLHCPACTSWSPLMCVFCVKAPLPSGVLAFEIREVTVRRCNGVMLSAQSAGSIRPATPPARDRWRRALWPSISHNLIEGADARIAPEQEQLQFVSLASASLPSYSAARQSRTRCVLVPRSKRIGNNSPA